MINGFVGANLPIVYLAAAHINSLAYKTYITIPNSFASQLIHNGTFSAEIFITQCQKTVYNKGYNKGKHNRRCAS